MTCEEESNTWSPVPGIRLRGGDNLSKKSRVTRRRPENPRRKKMNSVAARAVVRSGAGRLFAIADVGALQVAHSGAARLIERGRSGARGHARSAAARLRARGVFGAFERASTRSANEAADRSVVTRGCAGVAARARELAVGSCRAQTVVSRRARVAGGADRSVDATIAARSVGAAAAARKRSTRNDRGNPKAQALHPLVILDAWRMDRTRLHRIYRLFTAPNRRAGFVVLAFAPAQSRRYMVTTHAPPRPRLC
jgi:hypothetical protein